MKNKIFFSVLLTTGKKTFSLAMLLLFFTQFNPDEIKAKENKNATEEEYAEIIVTAQKRKQSSQEIPTSISLLNTKDVKDAGISSTEDISNYVPNFTSYHCHDFFSFYSIRGQSNLVNSSNSVGIYIDDEAASIGSNQTTSSLYEIERIEILRGPQGNLYGLNSAGGVVNIVTKKPDDYWMTNAGASYGNYKSQKYNANISGPIVSEKLFFGISGMYKKRDNYIEEKDNEDRYTSFGCGRFQLRWLPSKNFDILFTTGLSVHDANGNDWTVIDDNPYTISNKGIKENIDQFINRESLRIALSLPGIDIESVSARMQRDFKGTGGNDFISGTNKSYSDKEEDNIAWMEEFRLSSSSTKNALSWLTGAFYLHETDNGFFNNYCKTGPSLQDYTVKAGNNTELTQKTVSVFGELGYSFFRKIKLTGGLRYDHNRKNIECEYRLNTTNGSYNDSAAWNALSPRAVLDFKITDSIMTYISFAKGFKAGGYSTFSNSATAEEAKFDPEFTSSYETGFKSDWLRRKLFINCAVLYSNVDDLQIMTIDPVSNSQIFSNAAEARVFGAELEIKARHIIPGLTTGLSSGFISSKIQKHLIKVYEGNSVPLSPEYQLSLNVQYSLQSGIFMRGEYTHYGKTFHDESNKFSQNTYGILNLKAGYQHEHFFVKIYAGNILDKDYYTYTRSAGSIDLGVPGSPGTFGLEAGAEF